MLIKIKNYNVNIEVVNSENPEEATMTFLNELCSIAFDAARYYDETNFRGLAKSSRVIAYNIFDDLDAAGYYETKEA